MVVVAGKAKRESAFVFGILLNLPQMIAEHQTNTQNYVLIRLCLLKILSFLQSIFQQFILKFTVLLEEYFDSTKQIFGFFCINITILLNKKHQVC